LPMLAGALYIGSSEGGPYIPSRLPDAKLKALEPWEFFVSDWKS
jgi:hypothetical protein